MKIHGFAPRDGETAFAFVVARVAAPIDRAGMIAVARGLAEIVPEVDAVIAAMPEDMEPDLRLFSLPWLPPEGDDMIAAQRATLARAGELGVEELWFAQTSAQLPQTGVVRFAVDSYPEIMETFDWEDFGITCKLGGAWLAGEATVLIGLHALWLAPYGEAYRNTAVTIDRAHHAVHFWVDRFTAPYDARELVHHLLWVIAQLDEIVPVLHARFEGATMAQKYGGLVGDAREPFVLGGNPLRAIHALGGEAGIDAWVGSQTAWSNEEVACMLRELAIDVLTAPAPGAPDDDAEPSEPDDGDDGKDDSDVELDVDAMFDAAFGDDEDGGAPDDSDQDDGDEDDGAAEEADGAAAAGDAEVRASPADNHVSRRARHASLPMLAADILVARARAGRLDPRVAEALAAIPSHDAADPRLVAAQRVLAAIRDHAAPDDHDVN